MDENVRAALMSNLTVSVEIAGKAFGIGRNAAYDACKSGDIPSVRIGGRITCPTAPLRKMLGIEDKAVA
ncbi:helix-turn-helix domain-containing protein [Bradyrhizobium sp. AUGA SZCCT0160]|uniref:helix-turn-helix domain-containing protein n=1 Tax=Bradyrhizobium sp. AUGA SZCCT0160 TaxID=2807662 RepID=UPI001BA4752D|nr:helix-turn-helix domain-containing protein [Bradyrhizobium sp. AUGA SZCCT0160]MBR1190080.1 helix-turn-helix domain-containing protein [Bradyrhizobium sp. AUGA SZCCT0160]